MEPDVINKHLEKNILLKISKTIIGTLNYQKILQVISDGMAELLDIETAAIYLLEKKKMLYLGATTPPLDPKMPHALRYASLDDHPYILKTVESLCPQVIPDMLAEELSPAERQVVELRGLRSLIFFPFVKKNKVLGVLILGTKNITRTFSDNEVDLGQTVANQLSIGIQNARLNYDLKVKNDALLKEIKEKKQAEKELKKHRKNLKKLINIKTRKLDDALEELKTKHEQLIDKNIIIEQQNDELKVALIDLQNTQMKLIQSEKMASLGVLTAGVAHEINNPLNYIMGSYSALKTYAEEYALKEEEHVQLLLNNMKVGLEKATAIVRGLNQFSRANKSKDEICFIHEVLDNCLSFLNNQLQYAITIRRIYADVPVLVRGNAGQLHQAFLNILTNAVQSIPQKGVIEIKTIKPDAEVIIIIRDTGIGIPAEHLSKVTDPFFTTKEPGKGTGLGLSITFSIIRDHKGTLEFFSEPGTGTTVEVKLPSA